MSQFSITIVFYNVADTNEYTHISVTASAVKTDSSIITLIGLFVQRIATTRNCFAVLCVRARFFTVTVAVVVANDHQRVTCHAIIANGLSPFLLMVSRDNNNPSTKEPAPGNPIAVVVEKWSSLCPGSVV